MIITCMNALKCTTLSTMSSCIGACEKRGLLYFSVRVCVCVCVCVCLSACLSVWSHLTSGASVHPEGIVTYSGSGQWRSKWLWGQKYLRNCSIEIRHSFHWKVICTVGHFPMESTHVHYSTTMLTCWEFIRVSSSAMYQLRCLRKYGNSSQFLSTLVELCFATCTCTLTVNNTINKCRDRLMHVSFHHPLLYCIDASLFLYSFGTSSLHAWSFYRKMFVFFPLVISLCKHLLCVGTDPSFSYTLVH